jgi:hypothetical protein
MKIMKSTIYFFLVLLLCISCDPAKVLIIETKDKPNTSVTVYADSCMLPMFNAYTKGKLIVHMPRLDSVSQRKAIFLYGLGGWSDNDVTTIARCIDSIFIQSTDTVMILNQTSEIEKYLYLHRSGLASMH